MSKKTLLLDSSYQVLSFISERKAFKLLCKEKVEIVSNWEDYVNWGKGKINHPSILRLKNYIRRNFFNSNFSRKALINRDKSICQYCGCKLIASQVTIDHVLPKSQGGITSFSNCVVCCFSCNNKKANRTPEEAEMVLFRKPTHPSFICHYNINDSQDYWHYDWDGFLSR